MGKTKITQKLDTGRMSTGLTKAVQQIASGALSPEFRYKIKCGKVIRPKPLSFTTLTVGVPPTIAEVALDSSKLEAFAAQFIQ
jgi:hypothetical protein